VTWEQFERAAKFVAGITWATLELWLWGGRAGPLAFIGAVIGVTEAGRLYQKIRAVEGKP
jgi:hypothetical protein